MANRGNHLKLGNRREISFSLLSLSLTISLLSAVSTPAAVVADSTDSGINSDNSANSAAPTPASSAHWSLPFSGSIKPIPVEPPPNPDPITGASHPFPVANSYQVVKVTDDKGAPSATTSQVFHGTLPSKVLNGNVTEWEGPVTLDRMVSHLVDTTYDKSPEGKKLDKQVKHYSGKSAKAVAVTKDAFEHTFQYQGFDPSIRAGKLILDDKYKVRNIAWAEYERQKFVDDIHSQVVTSMMQLAEGIGMNPAAGAPVIASAKGALEALVGEEETQRTITGLTLWLNHTKVPDTAYGQTPWNTMERNKKLEDIVKTALVRDPVVKEVTARVGKYAHPNPAMNASVKVLDTGLSGIAYFAPGLAIPLVAESLEAGLKESTGGSEENKLERELLLDRRIQSRFKTLNHEASMAVDNYRYALVTRNPQLLVFSQQVITDMAGKDQLAQLIPTSASPITVPEAKDSKSKSSGTANGINLVQKKGKSLLDKLPL
jgi:hypothetical protein